MEAVFAGFAIHAYTIARKREKEILATIEPPPQLAALGGLPTAVPLALAVLFAAGYLGLDFIPSFMPNYSAINQTSARISPGDQETVYTNPQHRVEFKAPASWDLSDQVTKHLVRGRRDE